VEVESARRVLAHTALQVGGIPRLAAELKLSEAVLRGYIAGKESIPEGLMLKVIDVLLEQLPEPPRTQ
jgi:hypothetical protein